MIPTPVPFSETPYIPEFKQLAAIVGRGKLRADLWDSWGLIVAKHSWKRVLKAANALGPDQRWPNQVEALCIAYEKEQSANELAAQERERISLLPIPKDRSAAAQLFSNIRSRHGV